MFLMGLPTVKPLLDGTLILSQKDGDFVEIS
jgi:hypothetical protein